MLLGRVPAECDQSVPLQVSRRTVPVHCHSIQPPVQAKEGLEGAFGGGSVRGQIRKVQRHPQSSVIGRSAAIRLLRRIRTLPLPRPLRPSLLLRPDAPSALVHHPALFPLLLRMFHLQPPLSLLLLLELQLQLLPFLVGRHLVHALDVLAQLPLLVLHDILEVFQAEFLELAALLLEVISSFLGVVDVVGDGFISDRLVVEFHGYRERFFHGTLLLMLLFPIIPLLCSRL
mmetsp:Transcript_4420/g.9559  ORF Transcript_4420/g.9559 Transcript_4420/m.9559 type:complete len:230 (-) Transcript_4420:676-1365(-)